MPGTVPSGAVSAKESANVVGVRPLLDPAISALSLTCASEEQAC